MTGTLPNDGLLKTARILTSIFLVLLGIAFVGLAIAIPGILLSQKHVAAAMVAGATGSLEDVLGALTLLLVLGLAIVGLAIRFLRILRRMIASVGDGDPFIEDNADRLRKMGWIAIGIELLKIPAGAMGLFLASQLETEKFNFDVEFSLTGLLLALVLFILSRVFRHGAAMREDLEGTV